MDARSLTEHGTDADLPVTTSVYVITVVMNEEDPKLDDAGAKVVLARELQRALDDGYFSDIRYDAFTFNVSERVVVKTVTPEEN